MYSRHVVLNLCCFHLHPLALLFQSQARVKVELSLFFTGFELFRNFKPLQVLAPTDLDAVPDIGHFFHVGWNLSLHTMGPGCQLTILRYQLIKRLQGG